MSDSINENATVDVVAVIIVIAVTVTTAAFWLLGR